MDSYRIAVGCDHRGFDSKIKILELFVGGSGLFSDVLDLGCYGDQESCDYPDYARRVCASVISEETDRGILICNTGIGMCMAANRFPGIRAVLAVNEITAKMSRRHNDANVICLSAESGSCTAGLSSILETWFTTPFDGERHVARIQKMG